MRNQKQTPVLAATNAGGINVNYRRPDYTLVDDPTQRILDRLENVRPMGNGKWSAKCPAHEDRRNSLSLTRGDDGRCLLHCHAGCSTKAILDAVELSQPDLFPNPKPQPDRRRGNPSWPHRRRIPKPRPRPKSHPERRCEKMPGELTPEPLIERLTTRFGKPAATWEYLDCEWQTCGFILRWDMSGGKDIRPISRGFDDLWRIEAMPEPRPLYRLPFLRELGDDKTIWITEGEKAADALVSVGLEATTSSGGAKAPLKTDWTPLAGRSVVVWPDADDSGFAYAESVAEILSALTPPANIRMIDPVSFDMGPKQDAADYVARMKGGVA